MKILFTFFLAGLCLLLPGTGQGTDISYDDFSGPRLDGNRWWPREYVRKVEDGKLVFKLGNSAGMGAEGLPGRFRNRLPIDDPASVHTIAADVTVKETILDGTPDAMSFARIFGYFYNADESGGIIGDICASVMIGDRGNGGLEAFWVVKKVILDDPWTDTVLDYGTLIGPEGGLQYDVPYKLKLSYSLTTQEFSFEADGKTQSVTGPEKKRECVSLSKRLAVAVNADNGYDNGFIHAEFDNVYINNDSLVYDDFSAPLSLSNWESLEWVREPYDGVLRTEIQRDGSGGQVRTYTTCPDTSFIEARVRLNSDSIFMHGGWGIARVRSYFYNERRGPGSGLGYNGYEGDVFASVNLQVNEDGSLSSTVWIDRSEDADFATYTTLLYDTFDASIDWNTDYVLSIRFADNRLIFKCNEKEIIYPVETSRYYPYANNRRISRGVESRIFLDPGEFGYLKASFDDVRVSDGDIVFCLQDYDFDNDMDGKDVLAFITDAKGIGLDKFSLHFGRTDCP